MGSKNYRFELVSCRCDVSEASGMDCLSQSFFVRDAVTVAKDLLGKTLTVRGISGKIVETEAYCRDDPASHSFGGLTRRNAAMFGLAGSAYVYRSYGIHLCLNVVCVAGDAVLLRALEPTHGQDVMALRRGTQHLTALCSGPGKIGQALDVGLQDNGRPFQDNDYCILLGQNIAANEIQSGPRVGISRATELNWRFGLFSSAHLSRKF